MNSSSGFRLNPWIALAAVGACLVLGACGDMTESLDDGGSLSADESLRTNGSCTIAPNPVGVDETYAVSLSGMPIDAIYDVFMGDPNGNITWFGYGPETQDGNAAYSPLSSSYAGTWTWYFTSHKVSGFSFKGRRVYASCSVDVQ